MCSSQLRLRPVSTVSATPMFLSTTEFETMKMDNGNGYLCNYAWSLCYTAHDSGSPVTTSTTPRYGDDIDMVMT